MSNVPNKLLHETHNVSTYPCPYIIFSVLASRNSHCCGCRRSHQGWSQSPKRYPFCSGLRWGWGHYHSQSQSTWWKKYNLIFVFIISFQREKIGHLAMWRRTRTWWDIQMKKQLQQWKRKMESSRHLLSKPGTTGLGDPLPGVDTGVDPDGGAIGSASAELVKSKR